MIELESRPPPTPFSERTGLLCVRVMESINISLFRMSDGHVSGTIFGKPVILLTTTGRTTGRRHTKPLLALNDGDDAWIVVASRGGTSGHPQWYLNLEAYRADRDELLPPRVEARDGDETDVDPDVLSGEDRDEWWQRLVDVYPKFMAYQQRTDRELPVLRLSRH